MKTHEIIATTTLAFTGVCLATSMIIALIISSKVAIAWAIVINQIACIVGIALLAIIKNKSEGES